jgi:predicted nuclease of predicted toxin-antitoxin system
VKLVIDMNLSPEWVAVLQRHGWDAVHWSSVGNPRATDPEIMAWAKAAQSVVLLIAAWGGRASRMRRFATW